MPHRRPLALLALALLAALLVPIAAAQAPPAAPLVMAPARISPPSPYRPDCSGVEETGTVAVNGPVEPRIAANPSDARHLVAVWQQDRWSNGAARGLETAVSRDGGRTWTASAAPFSRCTGGGADNGGDYERVSDPWVSIAPDGTVHQIALAVSGRSGRRTSAILASRSTDGGLTWSAPATLQRDTEPAAFNDKESITADPYDARLVYAVWDRIDFGGRGPNAPVYVARSTDGGLTWEPARPVYAPAGQTIANQIVVLPDGELLNVFSLIESVPQPGAGPRTRQTVAAIRSSDKGVTWSDAVRIAEVRQVGVEDLVTGADVRTGTVIVEPAVDPRGGAAHITWQDGRFSDGDHADIALASSTDGGRSWSTPVKVNATPEGAAAFTPNAAVLADGTLGVAFYDLRPNTPDPATFPAAYWLATCRALCDDPASWRETLIADPFELTAAPDTERGEFLGDYQGLAAAGNTFFLIFVTAGAAPDRPSDVYFATATVDP